MMGTMPAATMAVAIPAMHTQPSLNSKFVSLIITPLRSRPRLWNTWHDCLARERQAYGTKGSLLYTRGCQVVSVSGYPHGDHLVQVILELVAQALSTQFAQRPGLDLSNAFPRQLECLTDFLHRPAVAIGQAIAQGQHRPFSLSQAREQVFYQLCACQMAGSIVRSE